ncbi:partner of Y14 and mago [Musca domestica]|uniref:Partner of Y14 and mago n=1 Tax=Musca domestica TaxID=7370 RepID=A0A9J7I8J3_MUSDO|nr:partner of Y14 and mago [Musca domestica]XP_011292276.2 partner of Y14 and mago [Musca domestica]XP_058980422.1 partner of Y14 and mago [Musca domestica]
MTSYSTNNEGTFIPASQRPDGTWRRARRVKDGYVPQEEVPLYESKGRQFAQRKANALPPGLCPEVVEAARREREKKEKAKAKKEAAAAANKKQPIPGVLKLPANTITETKKPIANGQKPKAPVAVPSTSSDPKSEIEDLRENLASNLNVQDETQDLQKKCKKLQKKLREIDEIEKKLKSGALKKPEKDQLDKVARKGAIEKELQQVLAQISSES